MSRNNLSVSTRTTVGQQLSADWVAKETSFLEFVKNIIVQKKFSSAQITNVDKVPPTFDSPTIKTLNITGE